MANPPHIAIIGAGIGGMSAAIRLAAAGAHVTIYEKNRQVGGKMSQIEADGFRWDTGPSVITMRHVFEELFATAGRNLEDYLTLLPVDPLTRYFYPNGKMIDARRDLSEMLAQIEAVEPRDVEGYLQYLAYAARIHRITGPVFIYDQPPTPASFLRVPVPEWFQVDALRRMGPAIHSFVRSPEMRQLLGRFATYVGASPYLAPATLNVIAHVELSGGVWYPQGGIYQIAESYARLCRELGVRIETDCQIEEISLEGERKANGLIVNGERIEADAVIANVDVSTVHCRLLPQSIPAVAREGRKLLRVDPSCSGFVLLLGVEGEYPELAHHNIFFSHDYPAEFNTLFRDEQMPDDATVYVSITSKTDPEHAPAGHENWFILVNAPALSDRWDWEAKSEYYTERVFDILAERGYPIRDRIRAQHRLTPLEIESMTAARRGALYGSTSNTKFSAFQRPHNRSTVIENLYFCGGTTHPGGGVPMVTLSGKVASELALTDLGLA